MEELIYKTERDSQTWRTDLWLPSGRGLGREGLGGLRLKSERKVRCSVMSGFLRPLVFSAQKEKKKSFYYLESEEDCLKVGK